MQRKRRGLIALWMACVLLLTTQPAMVGADSGAEIEVKLYQGTEVLKPGSNSVLWEGKNLQPGIALDANQADLAAFYGADLKDNCPDGYTRDGWRMWTDSSGLVASRWVGDTDANWADYMTGYFDYNSNTILAPNWVPEYSVENKDGSAVVIKKTEDGSILVNGDTVPDDSVGADGSVTADGTTFHFQWLREYKIVPTPTKENEIKGSVLEEGDYYDVSTGKWIKGGGQSSKMGIECELQPGDVVVVKDLESDSSAWQYYFNGYIWNENNDNTFLRTFFVTDDKENEVFYATVPSTGRNFQLWLENVNNYMDVNASISVFRADSTVADQTGAVYTGAEGNYCCQISYEKDVDDGNGGTEKKTFSLLTNPVAVSEEQEEYEITKVCGGNGSCSIEVDGEEITGEPIMAASGQAVTIKAVPADGYEEGTISVKKTGVAAAPEISLSTTEDEEGNKIRTFTMPDYPVTVSVDFKQTEVKDTDTTAPVISGVENGGEYYGAVTFKVEDASLDTVKVDGTEVQLDANGTYTIQPDNKSHTIVAKDTAENTVSYTVAVYEEWVKAGIINICGDNGACSIEVDGKEVTGSAIRAVPGQMVTVKAVPNADYEENEVSVRKTGMPTASDVSCTTAEDENGNKIRTFTMPEYPVTVSVSFKQKAPKTYTVTLPEGEGYIAAAKDGATSPVEEGGSYSFTVTVASGYEATENFKVLANGIEVPATPGNPYTYTIENITSDQVVTVEGIVKVKDTERPVISGVESGLDYYGATTFRVEDASPVDVWLDGKQIQLDKDGAYTIQPDNASHTITATDAFGNTISYTIMVYETWVRDGIIKNGDYQLKIGIAYRLGSGNWKVSGDDTVYVGGNAFYVPITKSYTLFLQSGVQSGVMKSLGRTWLKQ